MAPICRNKVIIYVFAHFYNVDKHIPLNVDTYCQVAS